MRYGAYFLLTLVLLSGLSNVSAQTEPLEIQGLELDWEYDFQATYISTKPLIVNETLFIRTSTSTPNTDAAGVYAFDLDGKLMWSKLNFNSTFHDMSPITYVEHGEGDCGAWPEMIMVGWSDGVLEALDPQTGDTYWSQKTEVVTWGITGSLLIDSDQLIVPTRKGVANYCLSTGSNIFDIETGLSWRNGVTKFGNQYFLGDEQGTLWSVSKEGNITSKSLGIGKIRHAPLVVGDKLLVHAQGLTESTIALVTPSDFSFEVVSKAGPSPGVPIILNDFIITTDSYNLGLLDCSSTCQLIDQHPFTSNGESSLVFEDMIMLPRNTVEGGWGLFSINNSSDLSLVELFSTQYDWYGTAGPVFHSVDGRQILAIGNDNGILQVFSSITIEVPEQDATKTSYVSQIITLILFILIVISGVQFLAENYRSSLKYFLIILVTLFTLGFGDISSSWSSYISQFNDETQSPESLWDENWPEEWMGTQIVIFEFDNQTLVSGGHLNHSTALELTYKGADSLELSVEEKSYLSLGKYIESFNDERGDWIFLVDGSEAIVSFEYAQINSDSIVHWKII